MTLQQFIEKWTGKIADFDNAYGGQCVDLFRFYVKEVLGLPQTPPVVGAKDIWTSNTPDFTKVKNIQEGIPNKGDIIIWGSTYGQYGHVAIFISGDINSFTCFSQNDPIGSLCGMRAYKSYKNVLGWLVPKSATIPPSDNSEDMITDQTKIDLGDPFGTLEVQAIRSLLKDNARDLTNWTKKYNELVESSAKTIQQLEFDKTRLGMELTISDKEIVELRKKLAELDREDWLSRLIKYLFNK